MILELIVYDISAFECYPDKLMFNSTYKCFDELNKDIKYFANNTLYELEIWLTDDKGMHFNITNSYIPSVGYFERYS